MLQQGFDLLRLDAEKISAAVCGLLPTNAQGEMTTAGWVPAEAASNATALADMLIATNTVHSFQLGDGDGTATAEAERDLNAPGLSTKNDLSPSFRTDLSLTETLDDHSAGSGRFTFARR